MTDQAQRLEIATVRAEIGSNITYRFNNDAIDAGGIPTESGDIKNLKLIIKEIEDKASVSTSIYTTVAAGLAATSEGGMFLVQSDEDDEVYVVWRKVGGVAVDTGKRALSSQAAEDAVNAAQDSADAAEASALAAHESAINSARAVDSIAALKALDSSNIQRSTVLGYYAKGDGGGGVYYADLTDTTTADNGGTVIVGNDGARWKLSTSAPTDVRQFGAVADGVANDSPAFQAIADIGGTHSIADGTYRLGDMVTSTYAGAGFPEVGYPSRRLSLLGNSSGNTLFRHDVQTGSKVAFKLEGTVPGSGSQGVHGQDRIGHFAMIRQGAPWPTGTGVGILVLNKAMFHIEDIHLQFLDVGVELDGCLSSTMNNMRLLNGGCGLFVNGTANSMPNALTFNALMASGNNRQGVLCNQLGAGNVFIGGSIENNGTQGVAGQGGFVANLVGTNGTACLTMIGVYFEGNGGQADIFLDNVTAFNLSVVLINCTFNRLSASKFVNSCIDVRSSGGGKFKVNLQSCSFLSTGDYEPSGTRPYVFSDGNVEISGWDTCTYSESTSIPPGLTSASSVVSGSVNAAGAMAGGLAGVTVTRVSAGVYNIDKAGGWGPYIDSYHVSITPYGPEARIESVTKQNKDRIQVVFRSHSSAENVDVDFSFSVSRTQ